MLAMAAITAIGAAVNLMNICGNLESNFMRDHGLATTTHYIQQTVPSGSLVFCADGPACNQLDAIGGYQIYDNQLFSNTTFVRLQDELKNQDKHGEPNPLQISRLALYFGIVSKKNASGEILPVSNEQLRLAQCKILDEAIQDHKRIFFVLHTGQNREAVPVRPGWKVDTVATWQTDLMLESPRQPIGSWSFGMRRMTNNVKTARPTTWILLETSPLSSIP
jgi:hypothetical protein